jgi:alpha-glucosidase
MNSAGMNNNASVITKTPKDLLWQRNIRLAAMANLASQGVVGLKVDGIQSDKQEMVQYLIEILEDAANAGLMVIYHNGAPPRPWERTWPNLLSTEGLVASEFYAESKVDHGSRMP